MVNLRYIISALTENHGVYTTNLSDWMHETVWTGNPAILCPYTTTHSSDRFHIILFNLQRNKPTFCR